MQRGQPRRQPLRGKLRRYRTSFLYSVGACLPRSLYSVSASLNTPAHLATSSTIACHPKPNPKAIANNLTPASAPCPTAATSNSGKISTVTIIPAMTDPKRRTGSSARRCGEAPPPRGQIPNGLSTRERMERKLLTKRGREAYKQRGSTIEAVFGQMVMRGLVRFRSRGLDKARVEWSLWRTAHNLLKLWRSGRRASQAVG